MTPVNTNKTVRTFRKGQALISTFGTTAVVTGLSLITTVLLSRSLGPEDRGVLLALTFWPAMLASLLGLSVSEGTTYWVARTATADAKRSSAPHAASGLAIQLAVVVVATVLTLGILPFVIPAAHQAKIASVILYAAAFTPLMTMNLHFRAVLQGRGSFAILNLVQLIQPVGYTILLIGLLLAGMFTVEMVMAAMIAPLFVSAMVGACAAGIRLSGITAGFTRDVLKTSWKFHIANVLLYAGAEADKLLIVYIMESTMIGYYAVAIAISSLGSGLVAQSLGLVLTREMAGKATPPEQSQILIRYSILAILFLIVVNGAASATTPIWLPILFGSQFSAAAPAVQILLLMGILKGLRSIIDRAMRATHKTSIGLFGELIQILGLITFAPVGFKFAGLEGFAWSLVGAQACALFVMLALAVRAFDIDRCKVWIEIRYSGIIVKQWFHAYQRRSK